MQNRLNRNFSRFDWIVAGVVLVLVVTIAAGALLSQARLPAGGLTGVRVAYLGPTTGPFNIWLIDPAQLAVAPQQLTHSETGIFDFSVSADGRLIAYAEPHDDESGMVRTAELTTIDLQSGQTRQITDCASQDAYCTTPVWRPDGKVIAYQRTELNTALGIGPSAPRLWILDMTRQPYNTFQLFQNSEVFGNAAQWSADGSKLVFYEANTQSVMVYDFTATDPQQQVKSIPSGNGVVGTLSPDAKTLIFPELLPPGETSPSRSILQVADLTGDRVTPLTPESDPTDDNAVAWNPDGKRLALTRTYLDDDRYTRGYQVYLLDISNGATGTVQPGDLQPLLVDADYQNSDIRWNVDGTQLMIQRFDVAHADVNTRPEIWIYDLASQTASKVVSDGFFGRWVEASGRS